MAGCGQGYSPNYRHLSGLLETLVSSLAGLAAAKLAVICISPPKPAPLFGAPPRFILYGGWHVFGRDPSLRRYRVVRDGDFRFCFYPAAGKILASNE